MDENRPAVQPLPKLSREDKAWLSRKYHRRVKLATNAILGVTLVSCVLFDWDTYLGTDKHIFRSVRPTVRRFLDSVYGIAPESADKKRDA